MVMSGKCCARSMWRSRQTIIAVWRSKLRTFLAHQGILLCGDGGWEEYQFSPATELRLTANPEIGKWLYWKNDRYTSPEIQNELLKVIAFIVLRAIAKDIQSCELFALMADEVAEVSKKEQVVVCLCYVDKDFEAHEEFFGIHQVEFNQSDVLITVLKDTLLHLNLPHSSYWGQCYDGASNTAGSRNGVAKQLLKEETWASFTHWYGHALKTWLQVTWWKTTRFFAMLWTSPLKFTSYWSFPQGGMQCSIPWSVNWHLIPLDLRPFVQYAGQCVVHHFKASSTTLLYC